MTATGLLRRRGAGQGQSLGPVELGVGGLDHGQVLLVDLQNQVADREVGAMEVSTGPSRVARGWRAQTEAGRWCRSHSQDRTVIWVSLTTTMNGAAPTMPRPSPTEVAGNT